MALLIDMSYHKVKCWKIITLCTYHQAFVLLRKTTLGINTMAGISMNLMFMLY